MNPPDNIRLSERAKNQLITMKRRTGIQHWNVLCRWAFVLSVAQETRPPEENIPSDSSVEMTWKTFGGSSDALYWGMLLNRAEADGVPMERSDLNHYFRLHLHRGISYLSGATGPQNLEELLGLALGKE